MKDHEIIRAVAELNGYEFYSLGEPPSNASCLATRIINMGGRSIQDSIESLDELKYLTSRDAIVPVIEKWSKGTSIEKRSLLYDYLLRSHDWPSWGDEKPDPFELQWAALTATPYQLCKALLRATGKWVE